MNHFTPRFTQIEMPNVRANLLIRQSNIPRLVELIDRGESELTQTQFVSLAFGHQAIGMCQYALGFPLEVSRDSFRQAVLAWEKVFSIRSEFDAFPSYQVDSKRVLQRLEGRANSLTNSRYNLFATCMALATGDFAAAESIASRAFDPPNAEYISKKSEVCRPNDHLLAYAFRSMYFGKDSDSLRQVDLVTGENGETRASEMAVQMHSIITRNSSVFCESVGRLLDWHAECASMRKRSRYEINSENDTYLCIWACGMSALAIRNKIISPVDLPHDCVYLPLGLCGEFDDDGT